jgi:VWA domain-containing protein
VARVGVYAALCLLAAFVAGPALSASQPSIRVDGFARPVMAVSTVLSARSTDAPSVFENGVPAHVVDALPVGSGSTVALVVDHSQSMRGRAIGSALLIARRLLKDEPGSARIAVFAIASKATQKTTFSRKRADARAALAGIGIDPRYGTRLYDGVALAANALRRAGGEHKVLILISDGQETTSVTGVEGAAGAALKAHVPVLPVGVADSTYEPDVLASLARGTEGAFLGDPTRSPAQVAQAADDVLRTWRVDYLTTAKPGDTVSLSVSQPGSAPVSTDVTIPGEPPPRSFFARNERTLIIIGGAAALVLIALGLTSRRRGGGSWVSQPRS